MSTATPQDSDGPGALGAESVLQALAARMGGLGRLSLRGTPVGAQDSRVVDAGFVARKRGEYQIQGEIARGGMGRILRAFDADLGREVALKVLDPKLANRQDVLRRFIEEAQVGGQLQHPGIVPVYELGLLADERPYFTMKLVKGRTLAELLAARARPEDNQAELLRIFEALCQTVAYAHAKGVIHRDLKPANVMVGAFGEVQLVDWGLSKVLGREELAGHEQDQRPGETIIETVRSHGDAATAGSDSLVGSILGTPAYMPPEQARGEVDQLDERADVFALGAILCEILTGQPPYIAQVNGDSVVVLASRAALADAQARLAQCSAEPALVALTQACLTPAAPARPRSAEFVARTLRELSAATHERTRSAELEAASARVRVEEERKARRLTVALALTGILVIAAGAWVWIEDQREAGREQTRILSGLSTIEEEVRTLQEEGRFAEAVQVARSGLSLSAGLDPSAELRLRAVGLLEATSARAKAAEQAEAKRARRENFIAKIEELRVRSALGQSQARALELDQEFEQLFREFGFDPGGDLTLLLDNLRASDALESIVPALDDWAMLRAARYGVGSSQAIEITSLAADLDPDEDHLRVRDALLADDVAELREMAREERLEHAPAATLWLLGSALAWKGEEVAAAHLLEIATGRFPAELRLRVVAAVAAQAADRPDVALRHISAAAALRPDLTSLALYEGECLYANARYPAAVRALERFLSVHPRDSRALHLLASCRFSLGDNRGLIEAATPLVDAGEASEELQAQFVLARIAVGALQLEDFMAEQRTRPEDDIFARVAEAFVVAEASRDPAQLERALAIFSLPGVPPGPALQHVQAMILLGLSRAEEALAVCDRLALMGDGFYQPDKWVHLASLRSRALSQLGRRGEAQIWLQEARRSFGTLRADAPAAWNESIALRQLRQAEADFGAAASGR